LPEINAARRWNGKQSTPLSSLWFFYQLFSRRLSDASVAWCGLLEAQNVRNRQNHRSRRREEVGYANFADRKRALNVVLSKRQHAQTATELWQAIIPKLCGESFVSVNRLQRNMQYYRILISSSILFLHICVSIDIYAPSFSVRISK